MYHYARAVALARKKDAAGGAARDRRASRRSKRRPTSSRSTPWGVPAKEIVQTARLVATGRLADASGDLDGAAKAYEDAIAIEDTLSYTEPPYWYYPVRQSLGSVRLRQGRLDDAEQAFRDSLGARAQQRLGARRARRGLQAQGRRAKARRRRGGRMRRPGSGRRAGRIWRGCRRRGGCAGAAPVRSGGPSRRHRGQEALSQK